jgi:hypothetical protein
MLCIADVKPVAEQDTDQSDASKIVLMTQSELDFKQAMASSNIAPYHQDEGQVLGNRSPIYLNQKMWETTLRTQ